MSTKTVEQLKQEAAAAQEALQKAEQEARDQAQAAKEVLAEAVRKVAKQKEAEAYTVIVRAVVKGLGEHDIIASVTPGDPGSTHYRGHLPHITLATDLFSITLEDETRKSHSRFHSGIPTGRVILLLQERYGYSGRNTKRFPQKKDGGYSYEKIAEHINRAVGIRKAAMEAKKAQLAIIEENTDAVTRLQKEFKTEAVVATYEAGYYNRQHCYQSTKYVAPVGKVFLRLGNYTLTPEQAKAVLTVMKAQGLLKAGAE